MSWASQYISDLKDGRTTSFNPVGSSMTGIIASGQKVTVAPVAADTPIEKGAVVLCKVKGFDYLHLVKDLHHGQFQIGNNKGRINGWIPRSDIYELLVAIDDQPCRSV